MATIRDVAKYASVSTATVSRVINNSGYVDKKTSKRVKEAIQKLDYRPNDVARSLFKGRSGMIALLVPDITNPFFPELARSVEDKTNANGYSFVLCNTDNDVAKQLNYLSALQQKAIDGFVIVSSSLTSDDLTSLQVPAVSLDRVISPKLPSVTVNNRNGARQAVDCLKASGCRRIAHVAGLEDADNANQRLRGYLDAVKEESWFDSRYIVSGAYDFNQAREAAAALLDDNPEIDGIFAGNDMMGAGVLHAAAWVGRKVPDDLAVIGFDGIAMSETLIPALSTMVQPIYAMGAKAADMLINQIETSDSIAVTEEFTAQLSERGSTL